VFSTIRDDICVAEKVLFLPARAFSRVTEYFSATKSRALFLKSSLVKRFFHSEPSTNLTCNSNYCSKLHF
jgi:hypothetical protein